MPGSIRQQARAVGRGLVAFPNLMQPNTPHFDFPFSFDPIGTSFLAVEQDTLDDVFNCVHATMRTHPRQRSLLPGFGVLDLTFDEQPLDLASTQAEIQIWEPRAIVTFDQSIDSVDQLVAHVTEYVSGRTS